MGGPTGVRAGVVAGVLIAWLGCGGPQDSRSTPPDVDASPAAAAAAAEGAADGAPVRGDWILRRFMSDPENLNPISRSTTRTS